MHYHIAITLLGQLFLMKRQNLVLQISVSKDISHRLMSITNQEDPSIVSLTNSK